MTVLRIVLARHAETEANAAGIWQSRSDAPLTRRGRRQVERLARRLARRRFDLVLSSPQGRARATAAAVDPDHEVDPRWRERDLSAWEGLTFAEMLSRRTGEFERLVAGEPVDGTEDGAEVACRLGDAVDDLRSRLPEGGDVLVVTHGGTIAHALGVLFDDPAPFAAFAVPANTALTTIEVDDQGWCLVAHNDVAPHLPPEPGEVILVRHGRTRANAEHRWQGRTDWPLDEEGRRQARRLAAAAPDVDVLFSSPLRRAVETAEVLAARNGGRFITDPGLVEMDFGSWEGLTRNEVVDRDAELFSRIFDDGQDLPRGGDGESFTAAGERLAATVERLADPGRTVAAVTHGGVTRAFLARHLEVPFTLRQRFAVVGNTALTRLRRRGRRLLLATYNAGSHLEP